MVEDPGPEGLHKGSRPGGWWKCGVKRVFAFLDGGGIGHVGAV